MKWPKSGVWFSYSLSKAAIFLRSKWELKAHVIVVGPLAFCVLWRKPAPHGVWLDREGPEYPDSWAGTGAAE